MDDEGKSVAAQLVDKLNDVVENITAAALNAAQHVMESTAKKLGPNPEQVAGTANEEFCIREATDAAAMPTPLMLIPKAPKKKSAPSKSGRSTPTYDIPVPDTPLPAPVKTTKKSSEKATMQKVAKKSTTKSSKNTNRTKSSAGRKAVGTKEIAKKVASGSCISS